MIIHRRDCLQEDILTALARVAKISYDIDDRTDKYTDDHMGSYRVGSLLLDPSVLSLTLMRVSTFQNGLRNGGRAGLVYGFLFAFIGTTLQALVQGEMGSM